MLVEEVVIGPADDIASLHHIPISVEFFRFDGRSTAASTVWPRRNSLDGVTPGEAVAVDRVAVDRPSK
jgi:hypothetical protein